MKSKFSAEMGKDIWNDWCLRLTHNGYQFSCVNIENVAEAQIVIDVMQTWIRQQKESAHTSTN